MAGTSVLVTLAGWAQLASASEVGYPSTRHCPAPATAIFGRLSPGVGMWHHNLKENDRCNASNLCGVLSTRASEILI